MERTKVILQQDHSDCGVACLLTIINFYSGEASIEELRRLSGTHKTGTSLLGLKSACEKLGFSVVACKTTIDHLIATNRPCILPVVIDNHNHFVVFTGSNKGSKQNGAGREIDLYIGDPARGLVLYNKSQLEAIWQTRACLIPEPTDRFKTSALLSAEKKIWLKAFLKKDILILSITSLIGIATTALGLAMAIFSQRLIDDILPEKNTTRLYLGIITVLLLLALKEGFSYIRSYFLIRQSRDFNIRIISYFYKKLLSLPKDFFDSRKIGDLTARLNDTSRIQKVISHLVANTAIDIMVVMVSVAFIFTYSLIIGIGCLVAIPVFFSIIYYFNKQISEGQNSIMRGYAMTESNYISTLQGIDPVKNYNKEILFEKRNNAIYAFFQKNVFSLGRTQIRISFIANLFAVLILVSVLFYASHEVLASRLKTGQLIAIIGIISSLLPSIANLAMVAIPFNEARVAFNRMFEFTGLSSESVVTKKINIDHFASLEVRDVVFRFAGKSPLYKRISFDVIKGEVIGLLGENGCGKSTFVKLLQKYYEIESGGITLNQMYSLDDVSLPEWRNLIGVVPQQVHIFNATVLENIAFEDANNKPEEVLSFLNEYGFAPFIDLLPQSFLTLVGEEGINLSGGQKQMIALARALYHKPQLLILDEATASLDRDSEQFVLNLLTTLKSSMGIIIITHRLHVLKSFCDRIYILENGETSISGNHDTLLLSNNLYSKYWNDLMVN